ncbi:hypothetical protein [Methanimicrococcus blatticola]|uniref:hypothetical protein n=1 Tax=Methanimicrococcus blatticola TaxID=91560 RepID=UPI00105E898F|nr:hypothetical protein [Methanimicrococcus blatticola]MBZ3935680.1 hypothetical protein [Methanimicrococcus blatticola]MCC2508199.1 hypothetical protein [Methanimicrococcus blatticola]
MRLLKEEDDADGNADLISMTVSADIAVFVSACVAVSVLVPAPTVAAAYTCSFLLHPFACANGKRGHLAVCIVLPPSLPVTVTAYCCRHRLLPSPTREPHKFLKKEQNRKTDFKTKMKTRGRF